MPYPGRDHDISYKNFRVMAPTLESGSFYEPCFVNTIPNQGTGCVLGPIGAFTFANFACDFALS